MLEQSSEGDGTQQRRESRRLEAEASAFLAAIGGSRRDAQRAILALQSEAREQQEFIDEAVAAAVDEIDSTVLMRQVRERIVAIQMITRRERRVAAAASKAVGSGLRGTPEGSGLRGTPEGRGAAKAALSPANALLAKADESESLAATVALLKAALGACRGVLAPHPTAVVE